MSDRIIDLDEQRQELGLLDLNLDEAECIILAWLLKHKLYFIGETSHKWSETGTNTLRHELEVIVDQKIPGWKP